MLVFGCALLRRMAGSVSVRRLMMRRFCVCNGMPQRGLYQRDADAGSRGGLMGSGWRDVISTDVWGAVLQTQFGGVWLWQIILAGHSGGGYRTA